MRWTTCCTKALHSKGRNLRGHIMSTKQIKTESITKQVRLANVILTIEVPTCYWLHLVRDTLQRLMDENSTYKFELVENISTKYLLCIRIYLNSLKSMSWSEISEQYRRLLGALK